ncbi:MAG TPA: hypothetical protein VIM58_03790 [Candidatus Methylacidiphilales bacterium]
MKPLVRRFGSVVLALHLLALSGLPGRAADAPEALAKFSVFTSLRASDIGADTVLGKPGPSLGLSRGVGVQTCYWLPLAPEAAAKFVQMWNPTPHAELGVFAYKFSSDFSDLSFGGASPQQWLAEKSRRAVAALAEGDLNLTKKEAESLAAASDPAEGWRSILAGREAALYSGAPYEGPGKPVNPGEELRALVSADPKVRQQMGPALRAVGLFGNGGGEPLRHWEFLTAERHGVLTLGLSATAAGEDGSWQLADLDYYSSGSYDVSVTLYSFRPWTVDGKAGSLVWEYDLIASPSVAESGGGMEGMAVASLFQREVKKSVHLMKADAGK